MMQVCTIGEKLCTNIQQQSYRYFLLWNYPNLADEVYSTDATGLLYWIAELHRRCLWGYVETIMSLLDIIFWKILERKGDTCDWPCLLLIDCKHFIFISLLGHWDSANGFIVKWSKCSILIFHLSTPN